MSLYSALLDLCMGAQIAKFMGPTWGPPGSCRPQMGPMLAPWILLSGWFRRIDIWRCWCSLISLVWSSPKCGHYINVIMGGMESQITSLTSVYSTVYSDAYQRKHQSSPSLPFVRGIHRSPVNSPHKWPVTWKMYPVDDVIMDVL